jgi:hypothetical protein
MAPGRHRRQFLKTAYTFRRFTHNYLLSLHHSLKGRTEVGLDVMAVFGLSVLPPGIATPFLDDLLDEGKFFGTPVNRICEDAASAEAVLKTRNGGSR